MKNIFITGGTTGIGLALCKDYLALGHRVAICGRDLSKTPAELNEAKNLFKYQVDVLNIEQLDSAVEDFCGSNIDLMVANAGVSTGEKKLTTEFKLVKQVAKINFEGFINTFEVAKKRMIQNKSGHIVAISSVASFMGLPGAAAYSSSKAAVTIWCESMAIDLKPYNVAVTAIAPGFIKTPLTDKNNHPMPFIMPVEKASKLIRNAIEKKKILFIFPWKMKIVTIILNKMPRFLYRFIMGFGKGQYQK